jgi:hypothetical protein
LFRHCERSDLSAEAQRAKAGTAAESRAVIPGAKRTWNLEIPGSMLRIALE